MRKVTMRGGTFVSKNAAWWIAVFAGFASSGLALPLSSI